MEKKKTKKVKIKDFVFLTEKHRKNARTFQIILAPIEMTITIPKNVKLL